MTDLDFTGTSADELATNLAEERIGLTAAGIQAAAQGAAPEPAPRFSVQHVGRALVLRPIDDAAEELLADLALRSHVEVRPVGQADGEPGSATRAGIESGWGRP